MKILAIESSCDETSAAVVEDGRKILSNEILSQIDIHKIYGGVVPEIASRAHIEAISSLTLAALSNASLSLEEIDAVAVTYRPGLIGALLVGTNFAKSLAYSSHKPLIAVNHIRGHVAANYLSFCELEPPFMALVVSGGHTSLMAVDGYTSYNTVGITRDDAAGEAFDKVARVMGIPYPGGKEMDILASKGTVGHYNFPEASVKDCPMDFSFSGLKTAVINRLHNDTQTSIVINKEDVAADFTRAVCNTICGRLEAALESYPLPAVVLAGGVSANSHIREAVKKLCTKLQKKLYLPPLSLCSDNAAMIASQAYYEFSEKNLADISLNAVAVNGKSVD